MDDKQYIIYSHMFVNVDKEYIYIYPKTYLDISSNDHEHEKLTTSGSNFDTVVIART